ncbi:hypothetical protein HQ447_11950 [bacterium]|nr:hypothetical protein [bacterium]
MKNSKKSPADQSPQSPTIALSIEGVNQELDAFRGVPSHELGTKGFHVESARRSAECVLREARVKLELAKLRGGQPSASSKKLEADLSVELEEISAQRKLGRIFESIALAADELRAVACQARPFSERLAELTGRSEALKSRLEDMIARDVRQEMENYESQSNELGWTRDLFENGKWRTRGGDAATAVFEEELSDLQRIGRYTGELTKNGALSRITELEKWLEGMDARCEVQLTPNEMSEMPGLVLEIETLDAAILEETRYSHFALTSARFQEERFGQVLEAARISAEGVVETYQITREMIALQVA